MQSCAERTTAILFLLVGIHLLLLSMGVSAVELEKRTMVTHIWEVGLDTMKIPAGSVNESPKFTVHNGSNVESWYLRVYPNGFDESNGWVSVYLVYMSDPPLPTTPKVEVFIDNKEDIDVLRKWSVHTYTRLEESSGWGEFAKPDVILNPNNGYVFDGKIRFGVRIASDHQIMDESENAEITYVWGIGAQLMELPGELYVESPKFHSWRVSESQGKLVEESWHVRVYPQGTSAPNASDTSEKQLAMFLVYDGDAPVTPSVGYLILNSKSENILRYWSTKTYSENGDSRGYNDMITKNRILDPAQGFVDSDGVILFAVRVPTSYASSRTESDVTVLHTWEVGLDTFKNLANDVSVESPKYTIRNGTHEEEWFMRLYPNGFLKENKDYVSLYLVGAKGAPTTSNAEVMIMNDSEGLVLRRWFRESYDNDAESNGFHRMAPTAMVTDPPKGFIYDGNKIRIGIRFRTTPLPEKRKPKFKTFIWEVSLRTMQNGGQHESDRYIINGPYGQEAWHLRMFPHGYTAENKGFLSLYLVYGGRYTSTPRAELFLVNRMEENVVRKWATNTYDHMGESIGFARFISTEHLLDPTKGFINNNRIKIGLRIPIESDGKMDASEECPVCNYRCPECKNDAIQYKCPECNPPPVPSFASGPVPAQPPSLPAPQEAPAAPAACTPGSQPTNVDTSSDLTRGTTNSTKLSVWKNVRLKMGDHELLIEEITTTMQLQQLVSSLTRTTGGSANPGHNKTLEIIFNDLK